MKNDFSLFSVKNESEVLEELNVDFEKGLSHEEAEKRRQKFGLNEITSHEITWRDIFLRQFKSPFIYLLIVASFLSFIFSQTIEGVMIIIFVAINSGLGFFQEYHSQRAIKLLKKFIISHVKVIRNGIESVLDSRQLVPGDVVVVKPGDILPADLRFLETENLFVDESILTGESNSVEKNSKPLKEPAREVYQASNIGFSGTAVVSGCGKGVIVNSGYNTNIGDIVKLTAETVHISSFEKRIARFSKFILRLIFLTLIFVFLANIVIRGGRVDFVELVVFSIALAVSVIPEALPVVTTFSLSQGALELARNKVVVKRLSAIEDLGSIEILCTDKTGTLTKNDLTLEEIFSNNPPKTFFWSKLASFYLGEERAKAKSAFDLALIKNLTSSEIRKFDEYQKVDEISFESERRRDSVLVKNQDSYFLIVKGAPEEILKNCTNVDHLSQKEIEKWMSNEGVNGRRVIAVALKEMKGKIKKEKALQEKDLYYLGSLSFSDPLKKSTIEAIQRAEQLGVGIKILTGDRGEVAGSVAYQIGLTKSLAERITGDEFERLTDREKHEAVEKFAVFARITPQQKYRIIELLQEKHEVGFLGEGINDAPALKIADVAIVVPEAVDIAREAADIVLLNRSLEVIIGGIKDGRKVFANTLKYIKSTLSSNFGNFYAIALISLMINFLPMTSLQILLINLLSDFPMIAVATDKVDEAELKKPKGYNFKDIVLLAMILGLISTVFDFIFFGIFNSGSPSSLQTYWFIGSILTELILIYSIRTRLPFYKAPKPSKILLYLTGLAGIVTIVIPFTAAGQKVFDFVKPNFGNLFLILGLVGIYFVLTESVKILYYKHTIDHKENGRGSSIRQLVDSG